MFLLINLDSNRFSRLDKDGAGVMMWKALEQQLALAGAYPFPFAAKHKGWGGQGIMEDQRPHKNGKSLLASTWDLSIRCYIWFNSLWSE